jgi:hypothetical protein
MQTLIHLLPLGTLRSALLSVGLPGLLLGAGLAPLAEQPADPTALPFLCEPLVRSGAAAESDDALLQAIPVDAWMVFSVRDLDSLRQELRANSWVRMFQDPQLQDIFHWGMEQGHGLDWKSNLPVDPCEVLDALHGSAAGFLVAQGDSKEPTGGGLLLRPGAEHGDLDRHLEKLLGLAAQAGRLTHETHGAIDLRVFEFGQHPSAEEPEDAGEREEAEQAGPHKDGCMVFARNANLISACFGEDREHCVELAHAILDRASDAKASGATSIAANERLLDARRNSNRAGEFEFFVDLQAILARNQAGAQEEPAMAALGFSRMRWIYGSANFGPGEEVDFNFSADIPQAGFLRKIHRLLGSQPREVAKLCPKRSASVGLFNLDLWGLWQSAWKLAGELDPEGKPRASFDMAVQSVHLEVEDDFLSQLTGQIATFTLEVPADEWADGEGQLLGGALPYGAPRLGSVMLIGVRDEQVVESFVDQVLALVDQAELVDLDEYKGLEVHSLEIEDMFTVHWAFADHALMVSMYPSALHASLDLVADREQPSVLDHPRFKPVLAALTDAPMVSIADTGVMLKLLLETMRAAVLADAAAGGETSGMPPLPSSELVDRYFKGTMTTSLRKRANSLEFSLSTR